MSYNAQRLIQKHLQTIAGNLLLVSQHVIKDIEQYLNVNV